MGTHSEDIMKKVLVALNLNEQQKQRFLDIRDAFPGGLEFVFFGEEEPTHRDLYGIDAAVGWLTTESVEGHDLDYIQIGYTGIAHFCRPGILQQKTLLANCPGIFGPAVCELMVTHTLNLLKKTRRFIAQQSRHEWILHEDIRSLYGSTVLIIGMGDLGTRYAAVMKAFGARTIGVRKTLTSLPESFDAQVPVEDLDRILPEADIVAMFLPGGSGTKHLMDERRLRLLKSDAIIVNGGRGNSIDPSGLKAVLRDGLLGGVGLDVTEPEPLPENDELWDVDRVLITPHAVGYSHMEGVMDRMIGMLTENLKRYMRGEDLLYVIDRNKGY